MKYTKSTTDAHINMSAEVKILPSGHRFIVYPGDTLLDAALRIGLALDYGCSSGNCGLCKARIVSGQVKKIGFHDYVLSELEKTSGFVLMCSYTATTDIVIEAGEARGVQDIPPQQILARVRKLERLSDEVMVLNLQTPRTHRLRFLAGQSVMLELAERVAQEYSIGSCPCDNRNLQFHVKRDVSNVFATHVFDKLKSGDPVSVKGPSGNFTLDAASRRKLVFIAWDTGFAPIKSLIEHAMALDESRPMELYWNASMSIGHYMNNLCRSWADALDGFRYTPLYVQEICVAEANKAFTLAMNNRQTEEDIYFYIAGPPEISEVARSFFLQAGIPTERMSIASVPSMRV